MPQLLSMHLCFLFFVGVLFFVLFFFCGWVGWFGLVYVPLASRRGMYEPWRLLLVLVV